jgi:hypothetical protein
MKHVTISAGEAADRLALRELAEAYAYCTDRRDAKEQMALFTGEIRTFADGIPRHGRGVLLGTLPLGRWRAASADDCRLALSGYVCETRWRTIICGAPSLC